MSLVRMVYHCLLGLGAVLLGLTLGTIGVAVATDRPHLPIFLLAFGAIALLAIGVGELLHPDSKPYPWGADAA